ncbi:MAG: TetR/AcrR family transcriptional regulator [Bacteroidia bacterium]
MNTKLKSDILSAAKPLFFKNGIKSITMDTVASELGMSKKTVYQIYSDKNSLITDLILHEMTAQFTVLNNLVYNAENPIHEMKLISENMTRVFMQIQPVFFYDLKKYHSNIYKIFQDHKNRWAFELIHQNIQKGIVQGVYRSNLDVSKSIELRLKQLDELLFNAEYGLSQADFINSHELSFRFFIYGLSTLEGHKLIDYYYEH